MIEEFERQVTVAMMHIRADHPFFGTLGLFATIQISDKFPTAATDGRDIWLNPGFIGKLERPTLSGLLAHELLHAALQHGIRRQERDPLLWNIAADIVVNGTILKDTHYRLPTGAIVDERLAHLSVEEVYEQLQQSSDRPPKLTLVDLMPSSSTDPNKDSRQRDLGSYWHSALSQAMAVARKVGCGFGHQGLNDHRDINEFVDPTLNWRELLWQYVVSMPTDYSGFDRRFVGQGLYLDDVVGETVKVAVAIDTSGSVGIDELTIFYSEIQNILDTYPQLDGLLYFADTDLYGPYEFTMAGDFPAPRGGGGTSFVKFFRTMEKHPDQHRRVCLYLTDGFGEYPKKNPDLDVIWIISPGGIDSSQVPFGRVVRMSND